MIEEKVRRTSDAIAFLIMTSLFPGCSSQTVKMIDPRNGASAECHASGFGIGASFTGSVIGACTRAYAERGYVPLERLSADEQADLQRRGLLPKN